MSPGLFARQRSERRRALRGLYRSGKRAMSISQAISSHIPYLRRFARALTGTQAGGDAYVLATLEAIVADPSELGDSADLRAALYRVFLTVWGSMPVNGHVDQFEFSADEKGARRNLDAISLRPRIA